MEKKEELIGLQIERITLLDISKYNQIKENIPNLKKYLSSSMFTSVQKNAVSRQKHPLINLVRQILKRLELVLKPCRLCDGYNEEGKKKYRRIFIIDAEEKKESKKEGK